jgi:hypothetical protein
VRVSKKLLKALDERDGHKCAWTGIESETLVPHHRSNRGMGGRKSLDRLSNLVWLSSHLNDRVESDFEHAESAREKGIKLSSHAEPSDEPIFHAVHGWVLLDDEGGITPASYVRDSNPYDNFSRE